MNKADIYRIARERFDSHPNNHRTVYNEECHLTGVMGEVGFADFIGADGFVPRSDMPQGDGGIDIIIDLALADGGVRSFSVDVKCAKIPKELWVQACHDTGKPIDKWADIYVLTQRIGEEAFCRGWEWRKAVRAAPIKRCDGRTNHYIAREKLRDMEELKTRYRGWHTVK